MDSGFPGRNLRGDELLDYFFTPPRRIDRTYCTIDGEEFQHLTHVMRKKEGEVIRVLDGVGIVYEAVIETIGGGVARCRIMARLERLHEPSRRLTLGVALLKHGSNFDFLVEKCVELGVSVLVPLLTERTISRQERLERWQKIALAAAKQSGRSIIPEVRPLLELEEFFSQASSAALRLLPHEQFEGPPAAELLRTATQEVVACIGPEGGFTEREITQAGRFEFRPVSLGPRRLRTETAAIFLTGLALLES
jgi:16S rRNA (uracil1498-N3)-methyltransferase